VTPVWVHKLAITLGMQDRVLRSTAAPTAGGGGRRTGGPGAAEGSSSSAGAGTGSSGAFTGTVRRLRD